MRWLQFSPVFALAAFLLIGCTSDRVLPAMPAVQTQAPAPGVEALLINGGQSKAQNYYSHLLHLRRLTSLLVESSVSRERITILSGDGENPEPDLATVRPDEFPDAWLLEPTKLGNLLGPSIRYENSSVEGMYLLPAKLAALETWFQTRGRSLGKNDTLLLYVTDHGTGDRMQKGAESRVVLWGEKISSSELSKLLDRLAPGVRVVMLMSQCFSGGFDRVLYDANDVVRANTCGFYSTLPHRLAWGCYADARESYEALGHSHRFFDALSPGKSFAAAHERVTVSDATPDVPYRSSQAYLRRLLRAGGSSPRTASAPTPVGSQPHAIKSGQAAGSEQPAVIGASVPAPAPSQPGNVLPGGAAKTAAGVVPSTAASMSKSQAIDAALVDELLVDAWKSPDRWQRQIDLLRRLSLRYGLPMPKSLKEWEELNEQLGPGIGRGKLYKRKWTEAMRELAGSAQMPFVLVHPEWAGSTLEQLRSQHPDIVLPQAGPEHPGIELEELRRLLAQKAVKAFSAFTRNTNGLYQRLTALKQRQEAASELTFRLEVREGVLLRMRVLLESIAGDWRVCVSARRGRSRINPPRRIPLHLRMRRARRLSTRV